MRSALVLTSSLLLATAACADTYYNPANSASNSGLTTGYELYGTIGCPGSGLLDSTCKVEPAKTVEAPVAVPVPAPVVVEAPAPAPVVIQEKAPAPAPVASTAPAFGVYVNPLSFCPIPKQ